MNTKTLPAWAGALLLVACATDRPASPPDLPELPAADAPLPEPNGTLESYIDRALQGRGELRARTARWRADAARVEAVDELPSPRIEYGYFVRSVETRVGPQRHRVMVRQTVPWPSKAASAIDARTAQLDVHAARYDAAELDIAWEVADAFWRAWESQQLAHWHHEHAAIAESLIDSTRTRVEVGRAMLSDVAQAELELSRARDMNEVSMESRHHAIVDLQRAALLAASSSPTIDGEPIIRVPAESVEDLVASARQRPDIEALRETREVWEATARASSRQRFPDFTFGADWIETGPAADPSMPESGKDPVIASIGITVPLWAGESFAAERAAEAESIALEADIVVAERDAEATVRKLHYELLETLRRIDLYRDTLVPQAEAAVGSMRGAYEVGGATVTGVILAQRELLGVRTELVRATARHQRAWAALERVVGRPIRAEVSP